MCSRGGFLRLGDRSIFVCSMTIDHIFILKAIVEEGCHCSSKVFCCIVDFLKAFDIVLREA
jgi:hypothetical protein